jgi:PAS domain-containing protein
MPEANWIRDLPASVTVIDAAGRIISMNEAACKTFEGHGGAALIGQDIYQVHPERARATIRELFETRRVNAYTIEKEGHWKLICQCPWYLGGEFAGYVEISLPIPAELPHHRRTQESEV